MCHYLGISDFRSIHACMMYLLHILLSEYQQVPQYANSGRRVKFCRQYECFNPTPLHPHLGALCFRSFQDGGPCGARDVEKKYLCAVLVFYVSTNARVYECFRLQKLGLTVNYDCGALWSKLFIRSIFSHFMYLNCVRSNLQRKCCCCMT